MPRINQRLGFTRFEADENYKHALDYFRKNDFDNAIDAMTRAIEALPTNAEYYAARGMMYLEDRVTQKALDDFETALSLFPYEMLAHYGRGIVAYQDKAWDAALEHFTAAYNANTSRPETLYYLALVYYHRREYASATNLMAQAHALFEKANDRRKADAARWVRELSKHVARAPGQVGQIDAGSR